MRPVHCLFGFLVAGVAFAAPSVANDSPENRKAKELVNLLASSKYRNRERAATELIKMGRAAKPALIDGKNHADPEVQSRCQQLLPQALALDLMFRVDRFLK